MTILEMIFTWFALLGNLFLFLVFITWLDNAWYDWTETRALKRQKRAKFSKSRKCTRTTKR